ncbi:tRNA (guanosine(37)-N1)-methyltransferase TrmD [Desulfovibrio gilichinskyi]|uniref:tRNA (guanine-N(1)-)-methyltransferase n=1 Tax=Desulfovibrio gilichinskyi TaxID=1519643 RepID=A0A1X7E550_9BACT|nr:tRNA (guanosine(37)-N1)-methyltransferase TrmD [Desulfovibrio gilichinskyi]SMF27062.1 tRNA (Guanine37-N(1)-) methyltransferase [Desulfovibrio gilichinskyi]
MNFNLITLFPEFFDSPLSNGLMSKAVERDIVSFNTVNPRDFAVDNHKSVDDRPYGGGPGMVMFIEPIARSLDSVGIKPVRQGGCGKGKRLLMLSPKGRPLTQKLAIELAGEDELTLVCGRYEGIDARFEEIFPVEAVSVGDFVLNGGEAGALCLIEAVARLLPDFMGHSESGTEESFSSGLLEYPHYTRPAEYEGLKVPEILSSGNHALIDEWRNKRSLDETLNSRPELLSEADGLKKEDVYHLRSIPRKRLGKHLSMALVHYPVLNKFGEKAAVSLTNLDIHDMSRVSRSYSLAGMYAVTPIEDQKKLADRIISHWTSGPGSRTNPDRAAALAKVSVMDSLIDVVEHIESGTGKKPILVTTSARGAGNVTPSQVREMLYDNPVLLVFGTGHGLAPEILEMATGCLRPLRFMDGYNHLSVRSAVAITVDRLLGDAW